LDFVADLVLFVAMKEFCKSIKNWQSYSNGYGGTLLTHSVCSSWFTSAMGRQYE